MPTSDLLLGRVLLRLSPRQLLGLAVSLRKLRRRRGRPGDEVEPVPAVPNFPRGLEGGAAAPLTFDED